MANKEIIEEWISYSKMDFDTAKFINQNMIPKPLEIICYHCQQSAEKILKAVLISFDVDIQRTHDLGKLVEELQEYLPVSDNLIDCCYDLTPYGVKSRYPQEMFIEENDADLALKNAEALFTHFITVLQNRIVETASLSSQMKDQQTNVQT